MTSHENKEYIYKSERLNHGAKNVCCGDGIVDFSCGDVVFVKLLSYIFFFFFLRCCSVQSMSFVHTVNS